MAAQELAINSLSQPATLFQKVIYEIHNIDNIKQLIHCSVKFSTLI